jgi:hypothetical protein
MAIIVNDRDVLLQATVPRYTSVGDRAMILSATSPIFHIDTLGSSMPGTITVTATLINITGTVSFTTSFGTTLTTTATTATIDVGDMSVDMEVVQAQITYDGVTYMASTIINKVYDGQTGAPAVRGPVQIHVAGYATWSDSVAEDALVAAGYGAPINRDVVTLYDATHSTTKFYDSGSWLSLDAYIPGNLLVTGTVSADVLSGGTINGIIIRFGTGHTINGYAFEITSGGAVWADNLFCGAGIFSNDYFATSPAVIGYCAGSSTQAGVHGAVTVFNTTAGSTGLVGSNFYTGTNGRVATGNGYDFYADGSGTNYGPFTGAHDVLIPLTDDVPELGDIVVDVECIARRGYSNTIFLVEKSTRANQPAALGVTVRDSGPLADHEPAVFIESRVHGVRPDYLTSTHVVMSEEYEAVKYQYRLMAANALGEGQINVCGQNGAIAAGDLIVTSDIPGKGMKQDDDLVRNTTVAKAREAATFASRDEIKTIACIYLCG